MTIRKGDSLEVLDRMSPGTVGAIVSDPPFFINTGRAEGWHQDRGFGQDPWETGVGDVESAIRWSTSYTEQFIRVVRPGGAIALMAGSVQAASAWTIAAERVNLSWMAELVVLWNQGKPRMRNFGSLYTKILWFTKPGARHAWNNPMRSIYSNVLVARKVPLAERDHPAQKPIEITTFLISLLTKPGDLVVDPFCGVGSTGVSAAIVGREFLGIERDQEYCDIARKRIANFEAEDENPLYLWRNGTMEEV